jgi:hypothetical protein
LSLHSFDPSIAARVGVNAAVIYQNLIFWTEKNAANRRHIYDGKCWTYNSVKAFSELFPYLTPAQIRLALAKLVTEGMIGEGNFNQAGYDRTKWYCVLSQVHLSEIANGTARNSKPIPDGKPYSKPDTPPNPRKRGKRQDDFSKQIEFAGRAHRTPSEECF